MNKSILLINGPNLNLLGTRQPETYGTTTLADLEKMCLDHARSKGIELVAFQSNHEGELIEAIHKSKGVHSHLVINPGAYSHTSIALYDAITGVEAVVYEVHISNIHARESFRHHSYVSEVAKSVVCGMGLQGYIASIDAIAAE